MEKLRFFDSLKIKTPKEMIYKRLGYRDFVSDISSQQKVEFDNYIDEGSLLLDLKAGVLIISVKEKDSQKVEFINGVSFESKILISLLTSCKEAIFMAVTAGSRIIEEIKSSGNNNLTKSVVYDAVASESVDASLNLLCDYFNQELFRENRRLTTRRISCGYADFKIEDQIKIYNILQLNRLGVSITERFILNPEKSVTALYGVEGV